MITCCPYAFWQQYQIHRLLKKKVTIIWSQPKSQGAFFVKDPTCFCKELSKQKDDEKIKFVMTNRLCWHCLRGKHHFLDCKSNFLCSTCKGKHALVLHELTMKVPHNNDTTQIKRNNPIKL